MTDDRWLERVATELRDVQPPSDLTGRILDRVRAEPRRPARAPRWIWVTTGLVAAAAVLLVARPRTDPSGGGAPLPTRPKSIAFAVDAGAASHVSLVGDFNNWDRSGTPMTRDDGGAWHASVALPVGIYRYAFLVDDARWIVDPAEAALVDHDFGQPTSVVAVE